MIPFRLNTNKEADLEISFVKKGNGAYYKILLIYDPLQEIYLEKTCECPDCQIRKRDCKHIKEALECLENYEKELQDAQIKLSTS